jgi:hypothetical protein
MNEPVIFLYSGSIFFPDPPLTEVAWPDGKDKKMYLRKDSRVKNDGGKTKV